MIDRAIERYHTRQSIHRHIDAQPDYALYNSGGRIIPHLTTHTYHRYKPTTILGRLFGLQNWIPPPSPPSSPDSDREQVNKVIQPEMNPGDCWPMQGGWGQVAIQLAKRVVVTEIVIEHVDPRIALHRGTAPREIEIWQQQQPIGPCDGSKDGDRIGEAETEIETVRRFSIPLSKQNVPAYGIVVRVLSNWGHPDFTCLYRVRVHGRAV
ncbi:UNC-like C-terminal-domain-containing protein [Linnemannia elongata]|nr:UNC-like C-terminal-domain-containing protein [Linnemannia elongata]